MVGLGYNLLVPSVGQDSDIADRAGHPVTYRWLSGRRGPPHDGGRRYRRGRVEYAARNGGTQQLMRGATEAGGMLTGEHLAGAGFTRATTVLG